MCLSKWSMLYEAHEVKGKVPKAHGLAFIETLYQKYVNIPTPSFNLVSLILKKSLSSISYSTHSLFLISNNHISFLHRRRESQESKKNEVYFLIDITDLWRNFLRLISKCYSVSLVVKFELCLLHLPVRKKHPCVFFN